MSKLRAVRVLFLKAAILSLAFSWPLDNLLFRRAGYVLFGVSLLAALAVRRRRPESGVTLYLFVIGAAFLAQLFFLPIEWQQAAFGMSAYFILPALVAHIPLMRYSEMLEVFGALKFVVVVYFIGLVLQLTGVENEILRLDQTETLGEVHDRYTSVSGGALLLGLFSCVALVAFLAEYAGATTRGQRQRLLLFIGMAIVCLYFSYARRYYVLALLASAYYFWTIRKTHRRLFRLAIAGAIGLSVVVVVFAPSSVARLIAITDIEEERGNALRIFYWFNAIQTTIEHPWLGLGAGTEGTAGQSDEDVQIRLDEGAIAESYYLKMGVEFGAIVAVFFLLWMIWMLRESLSSRTEGYFLYRAMPLIGAVECIAGTGLASPFFGFFFWLVISQILGLHAARPGSQRTSLLQGTAPPQ